MLDYDCTELGAQLSERVETTEKLREGVGENVAYSRRIQLLVAGEDRGKLARLDVAMCDGLRVESASVKLWLDQWAEPEVGR